MSNKHQAITFQVSTRVTYGGHHSICSKLTSCNHDITWTQTVSIWPRIYAPDLKVSWWRHQMEAFSTPLAICAGNSPVPGDFPAQRPVARNFDVSFDLRRDKQLSKQWWGWWFETLSIPSWRHSNDYTVFVCDQMLIQPGSFKRLTKLSWIKCRPPPGG